MMLEYEEECTKRNLKYSVIVEAGDPRERICTLAKEHGVDFLFLGKKGKTTLERYRFAFLINAGFSTLRLTLATLSLSRAFVGSVSRHCLEHAPCSVVVAH
ncbi:hypothetical protein QOT17_021177 [Balamuthia mandrillaris]